MLFFNLCILAVLSVVAHANENALNSIQDLQWESRIILIYTHDNAKLYTQVLNEQAIEIDDRHIHWFVLESDTIDSNYTGEITNQFYRLTRENYFSDNFAGIKLIGKDGFVKASYEELELDSIYSLIDSMPMRQMEMQQQ